jgi:hypothetical protein
LIGFALIQEDILGCLRPTAERLAWAVVLSFGLVTIASVELAHIAPLTTVYSSSGCEEAETIQRVPVLHTLDLRQLHETTTNLHHFVCC